MRSHDWGRRLAVRCARQRADLAPLAAPHPAVLERELGEIDCRTPWVRTGTLLILGVDERQAEAALRVRGQRGFDLLMIPGRRFHREVRRPLVDLGASGLRDAGTQEMNQRDVADLGGDPALVATAVGPVIAAYVAYSYDEHRVQQQVSLEPLTGSGTIDGDCLPADLTTRHDQVNVHEGVNRVLHIIGENIAPALPK